MPAFIQRFHVTDFRSLSAIMIVACLLSSLAGSGTALAQPVGQVGRAAWCVDMGVLGGLIECYYHTFEQCMATARGVTNVCLANSFYVPRPQPRAIQRRDPRR